MRRAAAALLLAALVAACSSEPPGPDGSGRTASPRSTSTAPSGTSGPSGSPRVVGTVATGLEVPWGIAFLHDGTALVTERDTARVLAVRPGAEPSVVGEVPEATPTSEGGLLGIAVSPAGDVFLYATTETDNRILRTRFAGGGLGPMEPILTGIPRGQNHDGGRLAWGPDGYLWASTGEVYERERAADRDDLGGKILRMTPSGAPAPDNPFGTVVWSYGHRNVQGLAWVGTQLWASEFGADAWDELNRVERGGNHGWPVVEGMGGRDQGFVDPQRVWRTGEASPSGLAYAEGALWMAALRGNRLWRIPVDGSGAAGDPEAFLVGEYGRLRTVAVAPDGSLWVTTSNHDGRGDPREGDDRILRVEP